MTHEERNLIREKITEVEHTEVRTIQEFERREERITELRNKLSEVCESAIGSPEIYVAEVQA